MAYLKLWQMEWALGTVVHMPLVMPTCPIGALALSSGSTVDQTSCWFIPQDAVVMVRVSAPFQHYGGPGRIRGSRRCFDFSWLLQVFTGCETDFSMSLSLSKEGKQINKLKPKLWWSLSQLFSSAMFALPQLSQKLSSVEIKRNLTEMWCFILISVW